MNEGLTIKLIDKYKQELDEFKSVCNKGVFINSYGPFDWESLAIGFMIAKSIPTSDAVELSRIIRDHYRYWL